VVSEAGITCKGPTPWSGPLWQVRREDVKGVEGRGSRLLGMACDLVIHAAHGAEYKAEGVPSRHIEPIRRALGLSF
jgi:hypothetical protein